MRKSPNQRSHPSKVGIPSKIRPSSYPAQGFKEESPSLSSREKVCFTFTSFRTWFWVCGCQWLEVLSYLLCWCPGRPLIMHLTVLESSMESLLGLCNESGRKERAIYARNSQTMKQGTPPWKRLAVRIDCGTTCETSPPCSLHGWILWST